MTGIVRGLLPLCLMCPWGRHIRRSRRQLIRSRILSALYRIYDAPQGAHTCAPAGVLSVCARRMVMSLMPMRLARVRSQSWLLALLVALSFTAPTSAQTITGRIDGRVTDSSGAVLPGA